MHSCSELETLRQQLSAGEASDGQHTHNELYTARMLYHAHAARMWVAAGLPVVKSWRHHDGEECFGGEFFVVVAELSTGQVSNHYPAAGWDLFAVPEVPLPPVHDGHTPKVAEERLRAALVEVEVNVPPATPRHPRGGTAWSREEEEDLVEEAKSGLELGEIARRHRRTPGAVRSRLRRGLPEEVRTRTSGRRVLAELRGLWDSNPAFDWFAPDDSNDASTGEDVFERYYRLHPEGGLETFDE